MIAVALLVVSIFAQAISQSEDCSKVEMQANVKDYINELNKIVRTASSTVRARKQAIIQELNHNITRAFNQANCSGVWDEIFPIEPEREYDLWLWELYRDEGFLGRKTDADGQAIGRAIETFFWLIGKDYVFSSCVMTQLRNHIFDWIADECTKGELEYSKEELDDFFTPQYAGDVEFERNLRSFLNMYAYGYIASRRCGTLRDAQRVVMFMNQHVEQDFCFAAADTFTSDACFEDYNKACPKVIKCFRELTDKFHEYKEIVFGEKRDVLKKVNDCAEKAKNHWKKEGGRPAEVPTLGKLIKEGIRLAAATEKREEEQAVKDVERRTEVQHFTKAIVKAHFRLEACDCVEEEAPSGAKEGGGTK